MNVLKVLLGDNWYGGSFFVFLLIFYVFVYDFIISEKVKSYYEF